jgi:hypothetical protein
MLGSTDGVLNYGRLTGLPMAEIAPQAEWLGPKLLPDTRRRLAFKPNMYPVTQRVAATIFEVFIYYLRPLIH